MSNVGWLVIYVLLTALYLPLNHRRPRYYFETRFDKLVPTLPLMVIPYVIYYFLIPITVVLLWETVNFEWFIKSVVVTQLMAICFWYFVPNGVIKKRLEGKNIFEKIINFIYKIDGGTNGFPSAHVFVSLIDGYFLSLVGCWWGLPLGVLIASSTVFVKQHYIVDVPAGVLWAVVGIVVGSLI